MNSTRFFIFMSFIFLFSSVLFAEENFKYLALNQRVKIISDLYNGLYNNYSLFEIKNTNRVVNVKELFQNTILKERSIKDTGNTLELAEKNIQFYDRVKSFVASFQDSHLNIYPRTKDGLPTLFCGFEMHPVSEGFMIRKVYDNVLSRSRRDTGHSIGLGDIVLEIDGAKVRSRAEEIFLFNQESSYQYSLYKAAKYLTNRNFNYPKKPTSTYKIKSFRTGKVFTAELSWFYKDWSERKDAIMVLKNRGIQRWIFEKRKSKDWDLDDEIPNGLTNIDSWYEYDEDGSDDVVIRTGYINNGNQKVGVLQVLSFSYDYLSSNEQSSDKYKFMMPINTFITRLKKEQVPLIIDVRLNGGGRLDHGINILAAISQHGKVFAPTTTSFRVSPRIRNVMKNITESDILRMEDHDQKVFNQIKDAISQKRGHTYSFVKRSMISATPDIGGYEEDVVVLISERCGSACNAFASLLKKSKRVKLLGMPTKGEGAGFFADSHELLKKWKWSDSLGLFKLQIPNYLFGVPGNVGETVFINSKSHLDMNLENRPVIPHVRQSFSRDDYINGSRRWFQRSLGLLLKPYKLPSSP